VFARGVEQRGQAIGSGDDTAKHDDH
jgi:hypothetical protein